MSDHPGWGVKLCGTGTDPVPQGSHTCVGRHAAKSFANVQPSNKRELEAWRDLVGIAGRALPVHGLQGPLYVVAVHTIARPKTVPLRVRAWPIISRGVAGHGDVDKYARALLDGLDAAGVFGDDGQVCGINVWKRYPDSPGVRWIDPAMHLDRPGVTIRIIPVT